MDAADRASAPALLAAGADPKDVEAGMRRRALDDWLDGYSSVAAVPSFRDVYGAAS